jgi:tetratricopeptide (TPR) repeat protein
MANRHLFVYRFCLLSGVLILFSIKAIGQFKMNIFNIDIEATGFRINEAQIYGVVNNRYEAKLYNWSNLEFSPCQELLLSEVAKVAYPGISTVTLNKAKACSREPLYWFLKGEIAWNTGMYEKANQDWEKIPGKLLIPKGYILLLRGDIEQGRGLLLIALKKYEPSWGYEEHMRLLLNIGHSYRLEGLWQEAARYYEPAWSLNPKNTENAFFLSMSYREIGMPQDAIKVLEADISYLPILQPGFISSYYVQLGLAYNDIKQIDNALSAFRTAWEWIHRAGYQDTQNAVFILGEIQQLEKKRGETNP